MLKGIFAFIVLIHGLIHILGFLKAFQLAEINQLTQPISKPIGLLWLMAAFLFIALAALILFNLDWSWMIAVPALLLSQLLIILYWQDAKYGTIANGIILVGMVISYGAWSFNTMIKNDLRNFVAPAISERKVITKEMISELPPLVQKWLERSNVIGKEMVYHVHLKQIGEMRTTPDGNWMSVEAEQWFTTQKPGFIWIADVKAAPGIYLAGRDKYENGKGHMLIKLLSLIPVANAGGKEIDQAALVRYLAEIIWFPSAALNDYIQWEQIDSTTAKATLSDGDMAVSGLFTFDGNGDVISIEAKRYYDRKGGATLEDWFIQIEPNSYREFEGVRIPSRGAVTWKLDGGDFTWFKLEITDVRYNQ